MASNNPSDRKLVARIAALTRWSMEDPTVNAERGQKGLRTKFERVVDPDGSLLPQERVKRAERLYRAHMVKLSLKAAQAKRKAA